MSETPDSPPFDIEAFCEDPTVRGSAAPKILILRGPLYSDDSAWPALLRYRDEVTRFLAECGARLVLDPNAGYAYAEQAPDGSGGSDWPKLFYRDRFTYESTCVLVVLREWLSTQETKTREDQVPLKMDSLLEQLRPFSRKAAANVEKEDKRWKEAINKVISMGFLKRGREDETLIVRPIIKPKLSVDILKELKATLEKHANGNTDTEGEEDDS